VLLIMPFRIWFTCVQYLLSDCGITIDFGRVNRNSREAASCTMGTGYPGVK
jgi:hypothetical protein